MSPLCLPSSSLVFQIVFLPKFCVYLSPAVKALYSEVNIWENLNSLICLQMIGEVSIIGGWTVGVQQWRLQTEIFTCLKEPCPEEYRSGITAPCCISEQEDKCHCTESFGVAAALYLGCSCEESSTLIYYWLGRRFDSSSKTLASDILLESRPGDRVVRDPLLYSDFKSRPSLWGKSRKSLQVCSVFDYLSFACRAGWGNWLTCTQNIKLRICPLKLSIWWI